MAVCLKARLVQSDLPAADKRTRSGRLVRGQGRAQGWHAQGAHKVRTRYAQGCAQGLFNLVQRFFAHKVHAPSPENETHKVRTRSARILLWFRNKDLGKLPYFPRIFLYFPRTNLLKQRQVFGRCPGKIR